MGCGKSKIDDLPLVIRCRERKELIKAASDHRYALAASHLTYFTSLKQVGEALTRFVEEELITTGDSNSFPSSPVLTLPSDQDKKKNGSTISSSSSTSFSHSLPLSHHCSHDSDSDDDVDNEVNDDLGSDHLQSDLDSSNSISSDHQIPKNHIPEIPEESEFLPEPESYYPYYYYSPSQSGMGFSSTTGINYSSYYMKKSTTKMASMIYEEPPLHSSKFYTNYSGNDRGGRGGGNFEVFPPMGNSQINPSPSPPPPPPPQVSGWDFFNPFDSIGTVYPNFYPMGRYGIGSTGASSPDSVEVRKREGIPDLEDEIQQKPSKEAAAAAAGRYKVKQKNAVPDPRVGKFRAVPSSFGDGTYQTTPAQNEEYVQSVEENMSNPDTIFVSESTGKEEVVRKKGVRFEVDMQSPPQGDDGSSIPVSLTTLSTHATRDIEQVVNEIRDEFNIASGYGKEVALMLEVGKLRYRSTRTLLKEISSRILSLVAPPTTIHFHHQSRRSQHTAARVLKMAKANYGESNEFQMKSGNLSLTLETLYAWEKKLYKEVKDEERLRVVYEKQCKRLKVLDHKGADSSEVDATRASITKLLTKINITIRAIGAISYRIHKLRDEELQPQITELINGLIRMWKNMIKCHQKQFQAIVESKRRTLVARSGAGRDSNLKATVKLQAELLNWSCHFSDWISTQRCYIESLNGWLLRCLDDKPEETSDGFMPFSPSRLGAPPIFVISNDWYEAIDELSESEVANSINAFALSLHQLWERQGEEQRQRLKAEYLSKDFEKRVRALKRNQIKNPEKLDTMSDKSVVLTESGVSALDDLKVDLDSMRKRLEDEKSMHEETVKKVHQATSSSLQAGLIPIFETLGTFTSEMVKAYEHVRIQYPAEAT